MLIFIVPLKSASTAGSWERASRLFRRTIGSACAQTSPEFRVVVGCHEIPEGDWPDPRMEFVTVNHPPPSSSDPGAMRLDTARKRLACLARAMDHSPTHVMFLDSDDCVSNRLAGFVTRHPSANGWYIRSGYFYSERRSRLHLERWRFHKWCGSSHIVRPEHLDYAIRGNDHLRLVHERLAPELRERGVPLRPLPFRGAVYCVSHGDNFHDYEPILWPSHPFWGALRRMTCHRSLTPEIREEFGLYPADVGD